MVNTPQDKAFVVRTEQRDLCDPGTFLPIKVYYGYAENDDLLTLTANNADGTSYTGDISLLVTCTGSGGSGVNVNASQAGAWTVSVTQPVSVDDNGGSLTVDGSVGIIGTVPVSISGTVPVSGTVAATQSGAWATSVNNAGGASAVNIQDGGNSITVDGTVAISGTIPVSGTVAATQSGAWSVDVNNAGGASAVNIQDGGNSITVDGTVTANLGTIAGVATEVTLSALNTKTPALGQALMAASVPVTMASNQSNMPVNVVQQGGVAISLNSGVRDAGTQRVTIATNDTLATVTTVGTVTNITNQGQIVDNAVFTDGTTRINMSGHIFDEVAGTALTENDGAASRIDSKRAQVFTLEDATTRGRRAVISATGALSVAPGSGTAATGAITTIGTTSALTLTTEPSALLEVSGTYANISIIFEGRPTGSATYTAVKAYDQAATLWSTTTPALTNSTKWYYINTIGLDSIRVRGLSFTSGSMSTRWVPINAQSQLGSVEVINSITATLGATNFTDSFGNTGPGDGVQIGFQDTVLGDYQRQNGSTNSAWINPRDSSGNELILLQEAGNVSIASSVQPAGYTSIGVGNTTVTTAGTRVALAGSTVCKKVVICAKSANTGTIWVGGSTVASGSGIPLVALQQIEIDIANLTTVNIDSTVNGEGVTFVYYN
jgi:hypothetical protein